MKEKDFVRYLRELFKERNVVASATALESLTSRSYLNAGLLDSLDQETIRANAEKLLDEVVDAYKRRTETAARRTKVRDLDVRPVLKRRFCSMPPFCRDR